MSDPRPLGKLLTTSDGELADAMLRDYPATWAHLVGRELRFQRERVAELEADLDKMGAALQRVYGIQRTEPPAQTEE